MSHHFSMGTVLRRTPFKVLRWLLPNIGINLGFDWEEMHAYDLPKVIKAYEQVPEEQKAEAEKVVREIFQLADSEGVNALREAARLDKIVYWETVFQPNASAYLQAIWAWTRFRETFDKARKLLHANQSVYAKRRSGLPVMIPLFSDEILAKLKNRLQEFYTKKQGVAVACTVEAVEREEGRYSIFAYVDDIEKPILQHDERENLIGVMVKPVFEIAFDVNVNEGTLAVSSKPALREELEELFIETAYGMEPPPVEKVMYDIEKLKYRHFQYVTDPSDCLRVEPSMVKIKWDFHRRATEFNVEHGDNIHDSVKCYMSRKEITLGKSTLKRIRLRFYFGPRSDRRAGMITVEIGKMATSCIINCKDQSKVDTVYKCLQRWGIRMPYHEAQINNQDEE